jgi:katanin p80 WD40 repeat-containing subunit B1
MSTFMGDKEQRDKYKQYDMISDILKDDSKFTAVINARKSLLKPILTWWSENNIKNALYAMN